MPLVTREFVKAVDDRPQENVRVPEWGPDAEVIVKALSAEARDVFEQGLFRIDDKDQKVKIDRSNARAKYAIAVCVDDAGEPLFTAEDLEWLRKKNGKALDRIYDVGQRLSKQTKAEYDATLKNFGSVPPPASTP